MGKGRFLCKGALLWVRIFWLPSQQHSSPHHTHAPGGQALLTITQRFQPNWKSWNGVFVNRTGMRVCFTLRPSKEVNEPMLWSFTIPRNAKWFLVKFTAFQVRTSLNPKQSENAIPMMGYQTRRVSATFQGRSVSGSAAPEGVVTLPGQAACQ